MNGPTCFHLTFIPPGGEGVGMWAVSCREDLIVVQGVGTGGGSGGSVSRRAGRPRVLYLIHVVGFDLHGI